MPILLFCIIPLGLTATLLYQRKGNSYYESYVEPAEPNLIFRILPSHHSCRFPSTNFFFRNPNTPSPPLSSSRKPYERLSQLSGPE